MSPVVLVVDDDAALRASLGFWLDLEGFVPVLFESAEALLESDLADSGDCLILDQRLPGISGLDLLSQLRSRGIRVPAVLVTSNPHRALFDATRAANAPLVEKPLISDVLLTRVRHLAAQPAGA